MEFKLIYSFRKMSDVKQKEIIDYVTINVDKEKNRIEEAKKSIERDRKWIDENIKRIDQLKKNY